MKKKIAAPVAIAAIGTMTFGMAFSASAADAAGLTITDVAYGPNYVETTATENDTINSPSASSNITAVTLSDGSVIEAADGGVLTLVVDGDQYDILDYLEKGIALDGDYSFETTAGSESYTEGAKFGNMAGQTAQYTYRAALKVTENGIDDSETIPSLLTKIDSYDASGATGGELNLNGPFMNGITIDSAEFTIDSMTIRAYGDGANDFQGEGAAVLAQGSAVVNVNNTYIETAGVIRPALVAKQNGILNVNNSVIYAQESEGTEEEYHALVVPMMKRTPIALGLEGGVRATNVLGAGQGIYRDSLFVSTGWGVLSTDSGTPYATTGTYALDVQNTVAGIGTLEVAEEGKTYDATKEVNGVTYGFTNSGSGYIAYADTNVYDYFQDSTFYGGNEVGIIAGGYMEFVNCELNSQYIGIMTHGTNCNAYITDSDVNVGYTVYQIKSGSQNTGCSGYILLDNANVTFTGDNNYTGTLVELIESDDAGNPGITEFTINDLGDEAYAVPESGNTPAAADLINGDYTGNIWNNIYTEVQALDVNIDNASVTGTISSSYGYHVDLEGNRVENGTVLYADNTGNYLKSGITDYAVIGAVYNVASATVNNPVNVTLSNSSTWNVVLADGSNGEADACYIENLTVDASSAINAEAPVTIYYYGELAIEDGAQISENITLEAAERTILEEEPAASTYTVETYGHSILTINIVDEEGNPVEGAVKLYKMVEADGIFFTLAAESNYEIISGLEDMPASEDPAYTYLAAIEEDLELTVTVAEAAGSAGGSGSEGGPGGPGGPGGEGGSECGEGSEGGEGAPQEMPAAG